MLQWLIALGSEPNFHFKRVAAGAPQGIFTIFGEALLAPAALPAAKEDAGAESGAEKPPPGHDYFELWPRPCPSGCSVASGGPPYNEPMLPIALFVYYALQVYILLIFVWVIGTWVPQWRYQRWYQIVDEIVAPYMNLFRSLPLRSGTLDFTPLVAVLVLILFQSLVKLAGGLH